MTFNEQFENKQLLVTGGAGFIGSHLVDRLIENGAHVTVVDNLITGNKSNLNVARNTQRLTLIEADVADKPDTYIPGDVQFDGIFHLASPASPRGFERFPIETYLPNSFGTHHLVEYAASHHIPFLFTSTSESYGDPLEHPQKETYWGNVNPVGVRSCYDESKRFGEMVVSSWTRNRQLEGHIVRIFNTYGPRMDPQDGRVIPNFVNQALKNEPITVYGDGSQTRSFCFVSDLVEYIIRDFVSKDAVGEVINIGNPDEYTMLDFAHIIKDLVGSSSEIVFKQKLSDDPIRRKPDISKAKNLLQYEPVVKLEDGLRQTIDWFKRLSSSSTG